VKSEDTGHGTCRFDEIEIGEAFQYSTILWMRIVCPDENSNAVDLADGRTGFFDSDDTVERVNAKVVAS